MRLPSWKLWLAAGTLAVALFLLGGYFGLPALARWGIETVGSRELGRALKVERVRANPFQLKLTATGLTMADADPAAPPWLSIDSIAIDLSGASLWQRAPVLDALVIDGLRAQVVRSGAQRFNFSDIVDRLRDRPQPSNSQPTRFALYNIEFKGGAIAIDDRVAGRRHALTDINLALPFLSSIDSQREVKVQPALALRADGTTLALQGETLPFHGSYESSLQLRVQDIDLPRLLPYAPVRLDFGLPRGRLDADLRIAFRRGAPAGADRPAQTDSLVIAGTAALNDLVLTAAASDTPLLTFQRLSLRIGSFEPLASRLLLDDIAVDAPEVRIERGSDGRLNWSRLLPTPPPSGPSTAGAAAGNAAPFAWSLQSASVNAGRLHVRDESLGGFEQTLEGIAVAAQGLDSTGARPADLRVAARLLPQGQIGLDGKLTLAPLGGRIDYRADGLELRSFAALIARATPAILSGRVGLAGQLEFSPADVGMKVTLRNLKADGRALRLRGPTDTGAEFDIARLRLDGGTLDLAQRSLALGTLTLEAPSVRVDRLADGRLGWALLGHATGGTAPPAPESPAAAPFAVTLDALRLVGGQLRFNDASVEPATRLRFTRIEGSVRQISVDGSRPADLTLQLRSDSGGTLAAAGSARWDRLQVDLRVDARNLDLAAVRGYLNQHLNATLMSGEITSLGRLSVATQASGQPPRVRYAGSARLANLHVIDSIDGADNDLLRWQSLGVDRLDLALGDGPPRIDLGTVALNEFYARLILSEKGRLNLLDLPRRPAADAAAAPPAAVDTAAATTTAAARAQVRIGRIEVGAGNVNFTDNFIRPNYSANLTGLAGHVTALASDAAEPATLDIVGKVDNDAPLSIGGRLNPLAPTLQLDLRGVTKGVDLPRLTPYSTKYAGYPITKGKLSLDIRYKIDQGRLQASNHLFLDQLTFGERVESASATKLPVLLAVALLTNRRGEIDINLPISGSLDDPKFSIGGLVLQVIVNLLSKAVTAPFALLATAFGGSGESLSQVEFGPGSAVLGGAQVTHLERLAQVLNDRPGLRLDIVGRADAAADTQGLLDARYEARLRAAAVRQRLRAGAASVDPATVAIAAEERPTLIAAVYAAEPIADKPRLLGFARTIPVADMERLIRAHLAQAPVDLRALANARATAVRDWLQGTGKVARERLFLVEPRLERKPDEPPQAGQRVDFALK